MLVTTSGTNSWSDSGGCGCTSQNPPFQGGRSPNAEDVNITDQELLQKFAESRDEQAFTTLVNRHMNLVYGVACRVTGDPESARDVAQTVFVDLARKASQLRHHEVLAAWLYRAASFAAAKVRRTEHRRQTRETEAMHHQDPPSPPAVDEDDPLPLLDEALGRLAESERRVLILRFLCQHDLRTVGANLGVSEDAARKRVERALGKLRETLEAQGKTVPTTTLAVGLAVLGSQHAPPALAAGVVAAGLAAVPVAVLTLSSNVAMALGVAFLAVNAWMIHQDQLIARLQRQIVAREAAVRESVLLPTTPEVSEEAELKRLYGLAVELRRAKNESTTPAAGVRTNVNLQLVPGAQIPLKELQEAGNASPEAALQSSLAAMRRGDLRRYAELHLGATANELDSLTEEQLQKETERITEENRSADARGDSVELLSVKPDGDDTVQVKVVYHRPGKEDQEDITVLGHSRAGWKHLPVTIVPSQKQP